MARDVVDLPVAVQVADRDGAAEGVQDLAPAERPALGRALVEIERAPAVVPRAEEVELAVFVDVPRQADLAAGVREGIVHPRAARDRHLRIDVREMALPVVLE